MVKAARETVEDTDPVVPKAIASSIDDNIKKDFARLLYRLMTAKQWNQSDLAKATFGETEDGRGYKVARGRDLISKYLRGVTFPDNRTLAKLAAALEVEPSDLIPQTLKSLIMRGTSDFYGFMPLGDGTTRVVVTVSDEIAARIFSMLTASGATIEGRNKKRGKR